MNLKKINKKFKHGNQNQKEKLIYESILLF